jgi:predicted AAA+ superfamily ATPase
VRTASTHGYHARVVDDEFDALIGELPAIVFEGAKAVGKTETAKRRARTRWELDNPAQREVAAADPERLLQGRQPILIDEWQHVPAVWDLVRRSVDAGAPAGAYLLTGSAMPKSRGTHSGAGRIVTVRMRPLSLAERDVATPTVSLAELLGGTRPKLRGRCECDVQKYVDEIVASGFPGLRRLDGRALRTQLDGYITRIVDRDFPELGHRVRKPASLHRWMAAYAAASATAASFEKIRDAAASDQHEKPTKVTTQPYRDILERLWILDPLPAWQPTRAHLSELSHPPKHHLVDPALAARLLGVDATALIEGREAGPPIPRDGTLLGALFDSLVTQSVRVYAQAAEATVKHLRTARGDHEIDIIVERADGRIVAIEIKFAQTPDDDDVRHLHWLQKEIGDELLDAVVINTGREAYRRQDGIAVVPAALLGP